MLHIQTKNYHHNWQKPRSRSRSRYRTRSLSPPSQTSVQPTAPPTRAAEIRKKKPEVLTDDREIDLGDWLTMLYTKSMKGNTKK